jgi:hypothetical protein
MTLAEFLDHWRLAENPFQGEEARQDAVLARMIRAEAPRSGSGGAPAPDAARPTLHSDFDKILGPLDRPATSVVFGEKGSGKTAIRLQMADRIRRHNREQSERRVLLVPYDDLSGALERLHAFHGGATPDDSFNKVRLVDHLDAILAAVVPRVVDAFLGRAREGDAVDLGADVRRGIRRLDAGMRRDLLLLQALYDRADEADLRTPVLRRRLRLGKPLRPLAWLVLAAAGWVLPTGIVAAVASNGARSWEDVGLLAQAGIVLTTLVWLTALLKVAVVDRLVWGRLARRLRRQLRVLARADESFASSLKHLPGAAREASRLPVTDSDEPRYDLLGRLRRALAPFGYAGMIIVIDRVDEPTLINGDPRRMQAVIWPLLNNKFLQQEGVGVKLLLPIELRHALFRESSAFFQEARLDKQNLVERLGWSGPMLYDLCESRLRACAAPGSQAPALLDLFSEDTTRQDLVDALDQMHQPRDAFKFLYRCLAEHCSNVTSSEGQWRVPRLVLESIRRQESDRVQALSRGIRPA